MSFTIIRHRCNTIDDLKSTPPELGVEIDLRTNDRDLIVAHDPFAAGPLFSDWIKHYKHQFLILNVKEEALEQSVLEVLDHHDVSEFFFLDQTFPFLLKTALAGERRCAVRVSEFESVETALAMSDLIDWVWVDTFTKLALSRAEAQALKGAGLKLCLVSPDLLGRTAPEDIDDIQAEIRREAITINAVCTKFPERWTSWSA